jgi:CelD/BcsL family acetyltransferase involved in cellulose biosynthesis
VTVAIESFAVVESDEAWDELVTRCGGELFHTSAWLDILRTAFDVRLARIGLLEGMDLVAGMPVMLRRRAGFVLAGSPLPDIVTPQMGMVCRDPCHIPRMLDGLEAALRRNHVAFCRIVFSTDVPSESLVERGYRLDEYRSPILNLRGKSEDAVWKGFEGRARTAVRKAEQSGVEVTAATDLVFLGPYRDMATAVYAKRRRRPPDRDAFLRLLWSKLAPLDAVRVFLAKIDGELLAAAVIARHGTTGYYLDGVSRPEFNRLGANSLLQWRAIQWLMSLGIERYDMVGAGIPEIARFKRSFGSDVELRAEAMKATSLPARAGLAGYRTFAPLLRKLIFQAGKVPERLRSANLE